MSTVPSSDGPVVIAGLPVILTVHPRARRLKLRLDDCGDALRLTLPPRTSRRAALAWASGQQAWVEAQLDHQPASTPVEPGGTIPIDGTDVQLVWLKEQSRSVIVGEGVLSCGGPLETYSARIVTWLKRQARNTLSRETAEVAARAGVSVRSVSVGDPRSRWGSCSASGVIRYSWRLILVPPAVRRYVIAHEVAHRVHMNHGDLFKQLERDLFGGDVTTSRLLLRRLGPAVRRVGRGSRLR